MATRRERFLKMREKHIRRREKGYDRGKHRIFIGARTDPHRIIINAGRNWQTPTFDLQDPLQLKQSSYTHGGTYPIPLPGLVMGVHPAEWRKPPVPFIFADWYFAYRENEGHQVFAWHGYHRRRVKLRGRLASRMKGWVRRVWVANQIFMRNGCFPNADPLGRRPNFADVLEGAPTVGDPVWPGIPPEPLPPP